MRVETVDMVELVRRIEGNILDETEFQKALTWTKANCREGKDCNPPAAQLSATEKQHVWEWSVKMAMIARDLMIGNPRLAELGYGEEALGHNALAAGFQGQRQWTDHLPNGDFMEAILCSSFDWNGVRQPFIFATENDSLNGVAMLFGHLLACTAQVFADVRTYWSPEAIEKATEYKLPETASGGLIHLLNSGAAALDGCGRQTLNGQPAMKPFWDIAEEGSQGLPRCHVMALCCSGILPRRRLFFAFRIARRYADHHVAHQPDRRLGPYAANRRRVDVRAAPAGSRHFRRPHRSHLANHMVHAATDRQRRIPRRLYRYEHLGCESRSIQLRPHRRGLNHTGLDIANTRGNAQRTGIRHLPPRRMERIRHVRPRRRRLSGLREFRLFIQPDVSCPNIRFTFFCFAYYVLACGLGMLETNANPYVLVLGSEKTATRRLNFAQSFDPIGVVIGFVLCQVLVSIRKLQVLSPIVGSSMIFEVNG